MSAWSKWNASKMCLGSFKSPRRPKLILIFKKIFKDSLWPFFPTNWAILKVGTSGHTDNNATKGLTTQTTARWWTIVTKIRVNENRLMLHTSASYHLFVLFFFFHISPISYLFLFSLFSLSTLSLSICLFLFSLPLPFSFSCLLFLVLVVIHCLILLIVISIIVDK